MNFTIGEPQPLSQEGAVAEWQSISFTTKQPHVQSLAPSVKKIR